MEKNVPPSHSGDFVPSSTRSLKKAPRSVDISLPCSVTYVSGDIPTSADGGSKKSKNRNSLQKQASKKSSKALHFPVKSSHNLTTLSFDGGVGNNRLSLPPATQHHLDSPRSPSRLVAHPYARPNSLAIHGIHSHDISGSVSSSCRLGKSTLRSIASGDLMLDFPDLTPTPEADQSVFFPVPVDSNPDGLGAHQSEYSVGSLGRLKSLPGGTYPFRRRCTSSMSTASQSRQRSRWRQSGTPVADAPPPVTTPITCTLVLNPSADNSAKSFPFPDGTAYMMSSEQHRNVDQVLCTTKLLLHKLKRLLNEVGVEPGLSSSSVGGGENTGHLHPFAEQLENRHPVSPSFAEERQPSLETSLLKPITARAGCVGTSCQPPATSISADLEFTNLEDAIAHNPGGLDRLAIPRLGIVHSRSVFSPGTNQMTLLFNKNLLLTARLIRSNSRPFSAVTRLKPLRKPVEAEKPPKDTGASATAVAQLSRAEIDFLTKQIGHPEDWQLVYRLRAMPFAQAFSKLKLLLTFTLVAGTPISIACHLADWVGSDLCYFLFGASVFSLCTLCVFSYFSTKVIGVLSLHKSTGLLRVGLLNFWGNRRNILVQPEQILPPDDLSNTSRRTVRVGLVGDAASPEYTTMRSLYLTRVTGEIRNRELFSKFVGNFW
ncbi:unnamed protein product [Mesocestoides corti]|uniref:Transmembrane protein 186 n=1 Tax=Mesocestoides corti TaxID=53468 RepID=A0A158QW94_MESCO|nr:unnamed protein product [Mesocestoides corti]